MSNVDYDNPITLWVCADCMFHHANGECDNCHYDEGHDEEPLNRVPYVRSALGMALEEHECRGECEGHYDTNDALTSGAGIGEPTYCDGACRPKADECDCETDSFSTSSCDGCGSYLHGERYAMTEWGVKD